MINNIFLTYSYLKDMNMSTLDIEYDTLLKKNKGELESLVKINKIQLILNILNTILLLIFVIGVMIGLYILIRSPAIKSINSNVPTILTSISNYLNVIIPEQINKINITLNELIIIIHEQNARVNNLEDKLDIIINNLTNIISGQNIRINNFEDKLDEIFNNISYFILYQNDTINDIESQTLIVLYIINTIMTDLSNILSIPNLNTTINSILNNSLLFTYQLDNLSMKNISNNIYNITDNVYKLALHFND